MNASRIRPMLLLACLLAGCGGNSWVRLDTAAAAVDLPSAKQICRLDEKLAQLERVRQEDYAALQQARTNETKMVARDNLQLNQREIRDEIDDCMRRQGYRRGG